MQEDYGRFLLLSVLRLDDEPIWRIISHVNGTQRFLFQNGHIVCFDCVEETIELDQKFRCFQV